ncbi:MAG TPA: DUF2203 domain-containing protein [Ktedonobacterales bacterium]
MDRYFTLGEAEALLPRITPLLEDIQRLRAEYVAAEEQFDALQEKLQGNGHVSQPNAQRARETMARAARDIQRAVAEIAELGALVKDLESGLVDFPAQRQGREVYLCWRLGEEGIGWWHPTDTGVSGRQPMDMF